MNDIRCLSELGMDAALRLFRLKITQIATHGLEIIWYYLTERDFMELEMMKATFLKKAICLSKFTPSGLVYELAKEPFYIEELRCQLLLPSTVKVVAHQRDTWDTGATAKTIIPRPLRNSSLISHQTVTRRMKILSMRGYFSLVMELNGR